MALNRTKLNRSVISLVFGSAVALLPLLFERFPNLWPRPPLDDVVQQVLGWMSLPGMVVGMLFANGSVHDISERVVTAGNLVAYSLMALWFLKWRFNRRLKAA